MNASDIDAKAPKSEIQPDRKFLRLFEYDESLAGRPNREDCLMSSPVRPYHTCCVGRRRESLVFLLNRSFREDGPVVIDLHTLLVTT